MNLTTLFPILTPISKQVTNIPPYKFPAYIQLWANSTLLNTLIGRIS
jgi:hypothetical protein